MPTPQYENLDQMVNSVKEDFPLYGTGQIKRKINDQLRNIIARRHWSGLIKYSTIAFPAAYITGTITATLESNVITGVATSWPFNDKVNTTLAGNGVLEIGIQEATPTSMAGIAAGVWLTVDGGNAGEEAVYVIRADATTFQAYFAKIHAAAVALTRSSIAGRQIRVSGNTPFCTIAGATSSTRLLLDRDWVDTTASGLSYQITKVYVSLGQDVKQILTLVNPLRTSRLHLNLPKTLLDQNDPKRNSSGNTFMVAFHETDLAGAPLYEFYPRVTTAQSFMYQYVRHSLPLDSALDVLPNGIRSDVIVKRVKADAARWPGHKKLEGGIYYDPKLASDYMRESEVDIAQMALDDDNTNIMSLRWDYRDWPYESFGHAWQDTDGDGYW